MTAVHHSPTPVTPNQSETAGAPKVGQACLVCRRKKVKCDGKRPCHNCGARDQLCEYPGSRDNASASRQYAMTFEARCRQMETLCQRLEVLTKQMNQSIEALNRQSGTDPQSALHDRAHEDILQAAHVLRSLPELKGHGGDAKDRMDSHALAMLPEAATVRDHEVHLVGASATSRDDDLSENDECDGSEDLETELTIPETNQAMEDDTVTDPNHAGALVRDSYGQLRFVGGATSSMLLEAVKGLSPTITTSSPHTSPDNENIAPREPEIPLFVRGKVWPELPFLPKPDQLPRPPQYIADLLVRLYFDQLHYTFPVLYKPLFMQRYRHMSRSGRPEATDGRFLMVFYAVCACASSLLPSNGETGFSGIEYYERALLLSYSFTGEASLEKVQCLALLAMCAAGWNTLTQSWILAGQAVRAAQDIGLHSIGIPLMSSSASGTGEPSDKFLKEQVSRRIWWSIYTLDRVTSICLGRPMAVQDGDCSCGPPLNLSDDELERFSRQPPQRRLAEIQLRSRPGNPLPPTSGFLAFVNLCRIAGKIQRLTSSPLRTRNSDPAQSRRFASRVEGLVRMLSQWQQSLPAEIRFSGGGPNEGQEGNPYLTLGVIVFIIHAGLLLHLYRCLAGNQRNVDGSENDPATTDAILQCMSAARSCINASGLVRDLVPPSHHLALCVHYLTLSGIVLLRMPSHPPDPETIADIEKCVGFLKDLEQRWSGASRSRAIIEELLADSRKKTQAASLHFGAFPMSNSSAVYGRMMGSHEQWMAAPGSPTAGTNCNKRSFTEFEGEDNPVMGHGGMDEDLFFFHQIPGSQLFSEAIDFEFS